MGEHGLRKSVRFEAVVANEMDEHGFDLITGATTLEPAVRIFSRLRRSAGRLQRVAKGCFAAPVRR